MCQLTTKCIELRLLPEPLLVDIDLLWFPLEVASFPFSAVSKRVPRIKGYLVMLVEILAQILAKILAKIWARYPSSPGTLLDTTDLG